MTEEIQEAAETGDAQIIGSRGAPHEEQIAQTNDIAPVHSGFAAHGACLYPFERFHEVFSNGRLFGHSGRVAGNRKEHVAVNDHCLVFNKHAIGMVLIRIKTMDAHAVRFKGVDVVLLLTTCKVDVGRARAKKTSQGLGVGRRNTPNQRSLLLVQPHGGHGYLRGRASFNPFAFFR